MPKKSNNSLEQKKKQIVRRNREEKSARTHMPVKEVMKFKKGEGRLTTLAHPRYKSNALNTYQLPGAVERPSAIQFKGGDPYSQVHPSVEMHNLKHHHLHVKTDKHPEIEKPEDRDQRIYAYPHGKAYKHLKHTVSHKYGTLKK